MKTLAWWSVACAVGAAACTNASSGKDSAGGDGDGGVVRRVSLIFDPASFESSLPGNWILGFRVPGECSYFWLYLSPGDVWRTWTMDDVSVQAWRTHDFPLDWDFRDPKVTEEYLRSSADGVLVAAVDSRLVRRGDVRCLSMAPLDERGVEEELDAAFEHRPCDDFGSVVHMKGLIDSHYEENGAFDLEVVADGRCD